MPWRRQDAQIAFNVLLRSTFDHQRAMDKRIRFETKEESNARREREFLALTPHERFLWFLRSFDRPGFTARHKPADKGNFVIWKKHGPVR